MEREKERNKAIGKQIEKGERERERERERGRTRAKAHAHNGLFISC